MNILAVGALSKYGDYWKLSVNTHITEHQFCSFQFHLRLMHRLFIEQNFLNYLCLLVGSLILFLATWLLEIRQLTKVVLVKVS